MTSPSAHRPLLSPQCRRRGKCFQTSPWCTARKENNYSIHWLHVNQYPQSNVATSQAYPRYPKFQYPPIIANTLVCEVETDRFKQEGESFGGSCAQFISSSSVFGLRYALWTLDIWRLPPFKIPYLGVYWPIHRRHKKIVLKTCDDSCLMIQVDPFQMSIAPHWCSYMSYLLAR